MSNAPWLSGYTKDQGDRFREATTALSAAVENLQSLPAEDVAHAHSVLEAHKAMKKLWGYKGGVAGVHKLMPKVE